jgi:hypothetical protein
MPNSSYRTVRRLDIDLLRKNYTQWGPSTRTCIKLMTPIHLEDHKQALTSAAYWFTKNADQYDELKVAQMSHQLIVVRPATESRQSLTADFASQFLLTFISRAYARQDSAVRRGFYKAMSRRSWFGASDILKSSWFGASAGYILKSSVLLWLRHPPLEDSLLCTPAMATASVEIPACRDRMEFFTEAENLKHVDQFNLPKCLVPVSPGFPTLDAIVITADLIITMQVTVASKHSANKEDFERVYKNLPPAVQHNRTKCHVFVTDSEDKAKSLREQRLTVPTNISVYSTCVNIDQLDPIVTSSRMEELENEIVSGYRLICD